MFKQKRCVIEAATDEVLLVNKDAVQNWVALDDHFLHCGLLLTRNYLRRELDEVNFAVVR